jgi:hypothetical protein
LSAARGISAFLVWAMGWPVSDVSSVASSGTFCAIRSPRRRISLARSAAGFAAQGERTPGRRHGGATSASPPLATSSVSPVAD